MDNEKSNFLPYAISPLSPALHLFSNNGRPQKGWIIGKMMVGMENAEKVTTVDNTKEVSC